jgi:hypothetical protein
MKGLNARDMLILTKGFLNALNDVANGDEHRCVESSQIFEFTGLKAFGSVVVPNVIQELVRQGLAQECDPPSQIRITRKGKDRLNRTIESNVELVLQTLANLPQDEVGRAYADGPKLQELTELTPQEINDAVETLEEGGLIKTDKVIGTYPFTFYLAYITARGKYEYGRQSQQQQSSQKTDIKGTSEGRSVSLAAVLAGSPYGFTDTHWEIVIERKNNRDKLYVVFGYTFESQYYRSEVLVENIRKMFQDAIDTYRTNNPDVPRVDLIFKTLYAGYGEHLFNNISSDIISADIAVFEASDLNPNVMIEMGVAMTWGVRMLPIREKGAPKTPSDISGQTWAEYSNNGAVFVSGHTERLLAMVDFAIRKKRGSW